MSVETPKPPPIRVGVEGFVAFEAKPEAPQEAIDWGRLIGLPPFQMYAAERMRNLSDKDSMGHALDFVRAQGGAADVLHDYETWHQAKGCWPSETPMGEIKNAKVREE